MKAMTFRNDIRPIPIDNFKDHYTIVFVSTSRQDTTEKCQNLELVAGRMGLVLKFTFPPEHVSELSVLRERMSLFAVHTFRVVRKIYKMDINSL